MYCLIELCLLQSEIMQNIIYEPDKISVKYKLGAVTAGIESLVIGTGAF